MTSYTFQMTTPTLEQIDTNIAQLSLAEQCWLMERLARHIRHRTLHSLSVDENDLAAMASDSEIQQEIQQIDSEFSVAEMDGLGPER
jgi:hypothetical protein